MSEIREAYLRLARQNHPDATACISTTEQFHRIQRAWESLRNRDAWKRKMRDTQEPLERKEARRQKIQELRKSDELSAPLLFGLFGAMGLGVVAWYRD
eukprot:CAMPEP_0169231736 /NCGR_PEP_ID=MMETSP1016-20121227/26671_1 /TAXON_ID=342587 /ORGANISM="Karlodinium micrum, Strain CCMP2283" /LENGTH=97 /DNA_ID=CAMNT_0009310891 /DNA_START=112 /DNA_END=405 /DNA_ORIENTATION=-